MRSPLVPVKAQRGGTRPPAPLSPSTLLLHEGEDLVILVLALLLVGAIYTALRRKAASWGKMSGTIGGAFRYAAAQVAFSGEITKTNHLQGF